MKRIKLFLNLYSYPLNALLWKASNKLKSLLDDPPLRKKFTRSDQRVDHVANPITKSLINIDQLDISGINSEIAQHLSNMYKSHRFDILGSGWVSHSYNHTALGIEGIQYTMNRDIEKFDAEGIWLEKLLLPVHVKKSQSIWQMIVKDEPGYSPIDWQKDIKSGFRWNERQWYKVQRTLIKESPGVDIKMPFELARMQHLPRMAIFAKLNSEFSESLVKEFKCQVLDFIASNPVGMGVNWHSSMDVGIRTVNLVVAYDLFCQLDENNILDNVFKQVFSDSIYDHGNHIMWNLEYKEAITTNHYLFNLAGLLFASAYLDESEDTKAWYDHASEEIIVEMQKQFFEDGGNFEASTCYHRLSMEMMVYCATLIGAVEKKPNALPKKFFDRLKLSASLLLAITKKNGQIPQIGDNDSGRLFRFTPTGNLMKTSDAKGIYMNLVNYSEAEPDEDYWDEDQLDQRDLLSASYGLLQIRSLESFSQKYPFEYSFIKALAGDHLPELFDDIVMRRMRIGPDVNESLLKYDKHSVLKPKLNDDKPLTEGLRLLQYPESGIWVWKSLRLHLTISGCTTKKQQLRWGHGHNDKLSFELNIDGKDIIVDPGSYVYTPLVDKRNEFRSVNAHNGMIIEGQEQNSWLPGQKGIFRMLRETKCWVVDISNTSIKLGLKYRNVLQVREFVIMDDKILVNDLSNVPFKLDFNMFRIYSNGYGKRLS